jgi:hypothetical protein
MVSRLVRLAPLLLLLTSCGVFKRAPKKMEPQEPPPVLEVGQIDMVNEIQKFVLIHAPGRVTLSPGTIMDVMGPEGIKAKVKLAPERKGSYLTADIESGTPAKGDGVVWHRIAPSPTPTPTPSPVEENTGTFIDPLAPVPAAPVTPPAPVPSASISPPSASISPPPPAP